MLLSNRSLPFLLPPHQHQHTDERTRSIGDGIVDVGTPTGKIHLVPFHNNSVTERKKKGYEERVTLENSNARLEPKGTPDKEAEDRVEHSVEHFIDP